MPDSCSTCGAPLWRSMLLGPCHDDDDSPANALCTRERTVPLDDRQWLRAETERRAVLQLCRVCGKWLPEGALFVHGECEGEWLGN